MKGFIKANSLLFLLFGCLWGCAASPSPANGPAPLAELPSVMQLPGEGIILDGPVADTSVSPLKLLASRKFFTSEDVSTAIEGVNDTINFTNDMLNLALDPLSQIEIPVDPALSNFEANVSFLGRVLSFKMDFRKIDLNHDGILEDCSGCTCPIGCAADGVTACGSSAPISQLKKICVSIWLDDARFYAGAFDRVPTFDNPESGEIRMLLTKTMDLSGSTVRILYNHHDPFNLITDSLIFLKDIEETGPSLNQYFGRYRSLIDQRGEPEKALLDVKFSSEIFEREIDGHTVPGGLLEFQSKSFRHLDFINLELLAKGIFGNGDYFGYVDITPPTCALISSGDPIDPVNCSDLGLDLFAGDFVPLIPVENTLLPPLSQFPETPPSPPFTP